MEIGFEIIYCDFFSGIELVSSLRRPFINPTDTRTASRSIFNWARAVAQRYHGIGGGRVELDFSRMVSAFFYPFNTTNPNPRAQELPRLIATTPDERQALHDRIKDVASERPATSVDWQGVADLIVTRFSDRLALLAWDELPDEQFTRQIFAATDTYFEYPPLPEDINLLDLEEWAHRSKEAKSRCAEYQLLSVAAQQQAEWAPEDGLIHAAISRVAERVCDALFSARKALVDAQPALTFDIRVGDDHAQPMNAKLKDSIKFGRRMMRELAADLRWTSWKVCAGCKVDEVCFVAMWPFGQVPDHYTPGCRNETYFDGIAQMNNSYWRIPELH
jgi:hypothetical protein